jgi:glycerol kinase
VVDAVPGGITTLRADGGAAANPWLMQFQADLLGIAVEVAREREMTAFGAAALAAGQPPVASPGAVYEPSMSRDRADALHHDWLVAVQRARSA